MVMKKLKFVLVLFTGLLISACSNDGADDPTPSEPDGGNNGGDGGVVAFDRAAMLANWADNIVIPAYDSFLGEFADLKSSFESFRNTPDETTLATLRDTWLEAYLGWQRVSMFEIGPAEQEGLRLNINTYPSDAVLIETHASSGSYDFTLPSSRDTKGFPALDYLLHGIGQTDQEVLSAYTDAGTGPAYIQYFEDVLKDIEARVTAVSDAWKSGYRNTFVANDGASATASTDRFVNDYIFYYEKFLRAGKMGIPLGVFTGSPEPQTLEAFYSPGTGNLLFLEGLDAVQDFFNGVHFGSSQQGESLASYLRELNTVKNGVALDDLINEQFNTARNMVTSLGSFKNEIEENTPPTDMLMAYDEVQRVVPLLKVDMVSAMSIAIDFVDADGD